MRWLVWPRLSRSFAILCESTSPADCSDGLRPPGEKAEDEKNFATVIADATALHGTERALFRIRFRESALEQCLQFFPGFRVGLTIVSNIQLKLLAGFISCRIAEAVFGVWIRDKLEVEWLLPSPS